MHKAGSGWFLCVSWPCSEAGAATEILNNGMEKQYLYSFKLSMALENGGISQK